MTTSTVPAAKASITALLRAAPGLAGVTVDYGDPGIAKLEREHVFLAGTAADSYTWAPYGQLKIAEEYTLDVHVHVANPGQSQQDATERAFALFNAVVSTLRGVARTAATSVAAGVWSILCSPTGLAEYVTDQGYAAFVSGGIHVQARI